jgi:phage I-like protein
MAKIILSRNVEISAQTGKSGECWYHLVPIGRFPGVIELSPGREIEVIQDIDAAAIAALANSFGGKILVDFEHRSTLPNGDTTAAAWLTKVEARENGLWGLFEFSDVGKPAVENKRYRFLSPELGVDASGVSKDGDTVRPVALESVGLTNRPNLKTLTPLSNKEPDAQGVQNAADMAGKENTMKEIITALGLPDNAEMPAVLNAVKALQSQAKELPAVQNRLAALQKKELESEVEKDLVKFAPVIQNREEVKAQLIANRDAALKILSALKPAPEEKGKTVHNRADAKTPESPGLPTGKAAAQDALVKQIRNRDKCDYKTAFNSARREKPELFQEEKSQEE